MATRLTDRVSVKDGDLLLSYNNDLLNLLRNTLARTPEGSALVRELSIYFSTPNNERLRYPCCIFEFQNFDQREADNRKYIFHAYWTMTFIANHGTQAYASKNVLSIPYCSFDRYFKTDHLHHMVYKLYIKDDLNG